MEKIPWRREWLPTPVFLPGEAHGHRSLVGYSLWGHKELNTTERLIHTFTLASRAEPLEQLRNHPETTLSLATQMYGPRPRAASVSPGSQLEMQSLRAATDPALEQAPQGIHAQGGDTVDLPHSPTCPHQQVQTKGWLVIITATNLYNGLTECQALDGTLSQ